MNAQLTSKKKIILVMCHPIQLQTTGEGASLEGFSSPYHALSKTLSALIHVTGTHRELPPFSQSPQQEFLIILMMNWKVESGDNSE